MSTAPASPPVRHRRIAAASGADPTRWRALVVLCAAMLMTILDQTIVNVALPSIQDDLGFSRSGLAWVVNAYMVAFGGLLLLAGRLGDLAGRRNVLVAGLAVFTGASLLCGLAASPGALVAARFVQGVGGALASAVILGMIVTLFPDPGERARAIGAFSFSAAAGGSIGNIAGGLVTDALRVELGLPREPADRGDRDRAHAAHGPPRPWPRPARGVRRARRRPRHRRPDGRRVRHRRRRRPRLDERPDRRPRRRLGRPRRRVRGPAGDSTHAAAAAAPVPVAQPHRRQPGAGTHGGRRLLVPVPDRPLHRAGARVQRVPGRAGHPADRARDRGHLARPVGPPVGPASGHAPWCWAGWR